MLGFDPRGKGWDYDPVRQKKIDNQNTTVFQQITDLTGTAIPKKIITLISKTLNMLKKQDFCYLNNTTVHFKNHITLCK